MKMEKTDAQVIDVPQDGFLHRRTDFSSLDKKVIQRASGPRGDSLFKYLLGRIEALESRLDDIEPILAQHESKLSAKGKIKALFKRDEGEG